MWIERRGWLLPLILLLLAEIAMRLSGIESQGLARPSDVARALAGIVADGSAFRRTVETLAPIVVGLVIGGTIGLLAGIWFGLAKAAARLAGLSIELFRPIPPVALIPLALLIYGFGVRMEAAIIAFTCFWPMLLLTQAAVEAVDPRLVEVARVLGLGRVKRISAIVLPAVAPRVLTALRITLGIALIVAVTTEIAANPIGLGYAMVSAEMELRPSVMYAFIAWLAALGWAINAGLLLLQDRLYGAMGGAAGR